MNAPRSPRAVGAAMVALAACLAPPAVFGHGPPPAPVGPDLRAAIDRAAPREHLPVIITLRPQAEPFDLTALRAQSPGERRAAVIDALRTAASSTQQDLLSALRAAAAQGRAADIRPLWITNAIAARITPDLLAEILARPEVASLALDHPLGSSVLEKQPQPDGSQAPRSTACGLTAVHAPDAWAAGYTGQGVTVGVIDTGLCLTHPDIADHLWTNPGEVPANGIDDDNNGYTDDIHGWNFETDTNTLTDSQGHGSHVTGTLAGDGTQGTQCGMAPDAGVMTLKFRGDLAGESSVWLAMQYAIENGAEVLNGSLGWRHAWAPQRATWRAVCENAFAAGVVVVFSAGSDGSSQGIDSVSTPGDVPDMITVGVTDCDADITSFSSRGPVSWQTIDPYNDWPYPPGKRKPTLVAPGIGTISHNLCDGYTIYSGVSMAVPHVAGAAALMLQANPALDHYQIKQLLKDTATDRGDAGPDNTYGHGFLDAWGAVQAAIDSACVADFNNDGSVNTLDVLAFLNAWGAGDPSADINGDGTVNTLDVLAFLNLWGAGC